MKKTNVILKMVLKSVKIITGEKIKVLQNVEAQSKSIKICPISQTKGLKVRKVTLRGHVFEKYWDIISDENYFFCPHKTCPIIYFNNEENHYFTQASVKSRSNYKEGPEPRPACYCLNVLEHRILDEIVVKKCCDSLQDIKEYTGARTGKFCHITNPSGRCCGPIVNEIIAKGIELAKQNKELQKEVIETVHSGCEYCKHEIEYIEPSLDNLVDVCKSCEVEFEKSSLN